jgi:hypothetical protein
VKSTQRPFKQLPKVVNPQRNQTAISETAGERLTLKYKSSSQPLLCETLREREIQNSKLKTIGGGFDSFAQRLR